MLINEIAVFWIYTINMEPRSRPLSKIGTLALYFSPHQTKKQVRTAAKFQFKDQAPCMGDLLHVYSWREQIFLSLRILLSFRASGCFTFFLSFTASKTLHVWGVISEPDSITDIWRKEGEKRGKNLKLIFVYSRTASSIWMSMNSWHVDTSAEHVNYQPVFRLKTLLHMRWKEGQGWG